MILRMRVIKKTMTIIKDDDDQRGWADEEVGVKLIPYEDMMRY